MGDVIDWGASEPPNRYVLAFGTSHCLVEQDYDRSIYGECEYIGSRTLIKCKAVRKKADLKANGGICEMHKSFHDSIRNRFLCEDRRLMQENGQGKLKYSPFLNQDGLICEEHPWLMPSYRWESPLNRSIFDHAPDDDSLAPLWNARVYTERDLLRLRKILSEKRVEYLRLHAEMIVERARRRASDLFSKNGKLLTVGDTSAAVVAACSSIDDYGVISKRIVASQKAQGKRSYDQRRLCSFGKLRKISAENNDHLTISSIIHSILDCIADEKIDFISYGKVQNSKESSDNTPGVGSESVPQCLEPAVPLTMFCISHQMLDESQLLFVPCSSCHSMCADIRSPPLCGKHLRDLGRAKRASLRDGRMPISPAVNVSTGVPTTSTSSKIKAFNDPSKPLFGLPSSPSSAPFLSTSLADKRGHKRVSVDVQTKEETEEIFKRFRLEAPAQLSLTEAINQRQAPAVLEAIRRAELRRNREEACSCSRIRPFERTQFPPKSSVPRRINTISRPAVSVRRPFSIEGAPLQSPVTMQAHHASYTPHVRHHGGSDSLQYRHLSALPPRRSQPSHRFLVKAQQPSGFCVPDASSSSTFTAIDEVGNEVLIEDRRTPPSLQNTQGNNTIKECTRCPTAPLHSRRLISSYRRQIAGAILRHPLSIQHVGEDTSHGDVPRAHSVLPPPPDPPILPLSNHSGGPAFRSVRSMGNVGGSIHEMRTGGAAATTIAPASPRNDSQQTKVVRDQTASNSDPGSRLLPPPPSPLTLRQRFPSILRKTDSLPSPTHAALSAPPPSSLSQRSTQSTVGPRPPPPSRPLPPHRLIHSSVRAVPPHRLIKSLPLPAVPPPRPPKPFVNTDGSNTDVSEDVTNFEQQPNSSQLQRNEKDSVGENSDTLMSEDTEALRILAAVSEAAAAAVPNSLGQSQSKRNLTNNGDDDEEFEEEL